MTDDVKGDTVLIVDDAPENLRLLAATLKRGGLVPRPVTNGRLAIEAAVADPPDLVLLDVCMPEMSGGDVCRWLNPSLTQRGPRAALCQSRAQPPAYSLQPVASESLAGRDDLREW